MNREPIQSVPQSRIARLGEVLLVALVFFVVAGDPAPHINEPHYLCRLKHYWNPDWCAGDLFLESPEAHLTFVWAFGWMTKWLSLGATAWIGRIAAWTLLAWAWQRLSWRIVPAPLAAVLAAALWVTLTQQAHMAGEWVIGGVEAKCFAYAFVLLALRDLVDRRWNSVWLALGAATAFHALVGGWTVVVCGGIWLFEQHNNQARQEFDTSVRQMLPGLFGGGMLALLGIVPALMLTWNEPPDVVAEANRIYVFERLPHHLALLLLETDEVVLRFTRHGVLIAALWLLSRASRRLMPLDRGLQTITRFAWGAVLLAAIGLAIEVALWNHPITAAALLRYYWFRLTDVAVPLTVALLAVALIATGLKEQRTWAAWGLAAAILVTGLHLASICRDRLANPVPPSDRHMRDAAAWADACQWVAENSPPDALFLTPRLNQSFKWRTGRPEVATRKDIPQNARSMVEWFRRLRTIYDDELDGEWEPAASLSHLGTERVVAAARQHGARYVLTDNRHPLDLPIVYPNATDANDTYVIYRIDD